MVSKLYKFPLDGKTFTSKEMLYNHIEKNYKNLVTDEMPPSRIYFNLKYNKTHGTSVISGKPTKWNNITERYERFADDEEKKLYVKQFQERMMNKYGKTHLTTDPEQQVKMMEAKKNSFDYVWIDGSKTKCISTYESDFLSYLEGNYKFKEEYLSRAPVIYYRTNDNKIRFYLPDFYVPSLNLIIEIKGTNNHYQKRDYEFEVLKEKATRDLGFNYFKVVNKDYDAFDEYLDDLIDDD
jgi:hypothetical protein